VDPTPEQPEGITREQALSVLFTGMVLQQTQMALMLLGRLAHPETGETVRDIDGARLMIDQIEMLEAKTRGNLSEAEARLLKQNLTALRMAFVEAVEEQPGAPAPPPGSAENPPTDRSAAPTGGGEASPPSEAEAKKKFSKKY